MSRNRDAAIKALNARREERDRKKKFMQDSERAAERWRGEWQDLSEQVEQDASEIRTLWPEYDGEV